jgi:hypothetical protein
VLRPDTEQALRVVQPGQRVAFATGDQQAPVPGWRPEHSRRVADALRWLDKEGFVKLTPHKGAPPPITLLKPQAQGEPGIEYKRQGDANALHQPPPGPVEERLDHRPARHLAGAADGHS